MIKTSDKIKTAVERLHLADKTIDYIPVNQSFLRFSCPTGELVKHGITYRPGVNDTEGILLYDPKTKQYFGYFPERKPANQTLWLLTCTNGAEYDTTGQEHPAPSPVDADYGTCTVIGPVEDH